MNKKNKIPSAEKLSPFSFLPLFLVFLMILIMGLQKNYSPDLGFHLQSAKWILENKKFISTDSFTYTSFGNNYYDLQWLYQLVLYAFYKLGKDTILVVLNSLLIAFSFFLVWLRYKNSKPEKLDIGLFSLFLILGVQALPFEIRPHVFSWIFLNLLLLILESYKKNKDTKLFLVPIIILLWVNTHSLSILGLVVIGIYLAGIYFEQKKFDKQLLKFGGLSLLAFLINPYFMDGFLLPFSQLGIIKGEALQKSYIGEVQSPFTLSEFKVQGAAYFLNPLFYLQLYSIITVIVCIKMFLRKKITEALLLGTFFVILFMAIKNYGYFLMTTLPFVINFIQQWIMNRKVRNKNTDLAKKNYRMNKRVKAASIVLAIMISWMSITDGYGILRNSPYRFGVSVDEQSVPVEAVNFLNQNKIYGKLLNHLDFGGYLMYNYPEKVFIDGRLELPKQEFFKKYYNSLKPGGIENILREYDPDIIIFPYIKATGWWSYLLNAKNYRAVYFDGLAAIYLRNGKFNNIAEINETMICKGIDTVKMNERLTRVISEKKPSRSIAVLKSLWQKQYNPIDEQNKATFCFTYSYFNAALFYSEMGIRKSTFNPKNMFYNLSLYYKSTGNYNAQSICLEKSK